MRDLLQSLPLYIVLLPLIASAIAGIGCQYFSRTVAHSLTIGAVGISFILSCVIFKALVFDNHSAWDETVYIWGESGHASFQIGFLIDRLSSLMMVVVSFVSWMVHIYTIGYMQDDPGYQRFFSYISLFTFGMLMLVMANNFLQLFFGWEMVGLMSYLLIGFWYQKDSANKASIKAFLVNRIGDLGFLIGIAAIFYYFGSLDYKTVFENVNEFAESHRTISLFGDHSFEAITFICLALFVGAMGKSAQIPLHVWLPDSMEGPTPISALIHAATMVTAGIFMVTRVSPLFEYSETALNFILIIGSLTCFFMGILGVVQSDIKRIIAYSTLSQLGYMMVALGASAYSAAIFHLMTHAFFKALLFLGAGSVIIALHHEQNIWKMGNLHKYMPITYVTMLIGTLAIVGFPLFSGFYSKDLLIEMVKASDLPASGLAYSVVLGSVFITALYSFRLLFVVFHNKENMHTDVRSHLHESPAVVWVPLVLLAIPSLFAGMIFIEPLLKGFFGNSITVHADHNHLVEAKTAFSSPWAMALHGLIGSPFILAVTGIMVAWLCYVRYPNVPYFFQRKFSLVYNILINKYGFDLLNEKVIAPFVRGLGSLCWQIADVFVIDTIAVNGSAKSVGKMAVLLRRFQTGYLYQYAFVMIVGFLALLMWLVFIN